MQEETQQTNPSKKRFPWKQTLSTALFIVMIALLCWYLWQNRDDMAKLLSLGAADIAKLLLFAFCGCIVNCLYHKVILDTYRLPMDITDWAGVVCVSNAISYVLPLRGDLVFTSTYYKRVKGLQYVKSVSMLAGNIIFGVGFAVAQVGVALLMTGLREGRWPSVLWLAFGACVLALATIVVFSLLFDHRQPAILQKHKILRDIVRGFNDLIRNKKLLWRVLACLVMNNATKLLFYMTSFRAIGVDASFDQAMFYSGVSWLATIFAIVPGNLGIKEAIMGAASSLMGALFQNGVAASLLQRAAELIVYMVMGLIFAYPVWRRWRTGAAQKE